MWPLQKTWTLSTSIIIIYKAWTSKTKRKNRSFASLTSWRCFIFINKPKIIQKSQIPKCCWNVCSFCFFAGAPQYFYILGCLMKYRRMNENSCPQIFWLIFTPCKVLCYRTPTIYTFFVSHYNFGQLYKLLFDKKTKMKISSMYSELSVTVGEIDQYR